MRPLKAPGRRHLAATERVKGRPEVGRKMRGLAEGVERLTGEAAAIVREREELGFDPDLHRQPEEAYLQAERDHRRYLELKPEMDRVPVLLEQERELKSVQECSGKPWGAPGRP